jgi:hypothetical protein
MDGARFRDGNRVGSIRWAFLKLLPGKSLGVRV